MCNAETAVHKVAKKIQEIRSSTRVIEVPDLVVYAMLDSSCRFNWTRANQSKPWIAFRSSALYTLQDVPDILTEYLTLSPPSGEHRRRQTQLTA